MATAGTITRVTRDDAVTDRRRIEEQFILDETRGTGQNGESYIFLSITTHHVADRKHYRTSINRIFRDGYINRMAFSMDAYGPDRQPVMDFAVPVARHSVKALRAAHDEALARLMEQETLDSLIDWASRAETRD